jgi:SnoaL-like domain
VPVYLDGLRTGARAFATSMHVLGDPLIELERGADVGRMDTYAVVYQLRPAGAPEGDLVLGVRYLDDVARLSGSWVIHHRRAVTMWTRSSPPTS